MATSQNTKLAIGAGLLLLLFSSSASAKDKGNGGIDVKPPKQDPPPQDDPPDYGSNWGSFPDLYKPAFLAAEKAARIPGLARFLAIWSWGAYRAKKPFVTPEEAAVIASENPELCSSCQNLDDGIWSRKALERVTLPIDQGGAYDPPWPSPEQYDAWADFGSAGLFDLLAGSVLHLGIHEGFINPYLALPPTVLYELGPQLYYAGLFVHRVLVNPNYDIPAKSAAETWTRVRAVTASPAQYLKWQQGDKQNVIATTAMSNFVGRAQELGIDLSKLANPTSQDVKNWPGASSYFDQVDGWFWG